MCLTWVLMFAVPEDVLSQLPDMEGKASDTNYLVCTLVQTCPGGYQPAAWLSDSSITRSSSKQSECCQNSHINHH